MSNANTPSATPRRRHAAVAAVWVFSVAAFVACDTGSLLIGTVGNQVADASLIALSVTPGVLNPVFNPDTTSYGVAVATSITSVTVTATARDPAATISVNGDSLANGGTSSSIPLDQGATATILVRVLASDSLTFRTYSIAVLRASQ